MTVYLLVGPTAAGNTTALNHLRQRGLLTVETSDYVKELLRTYNCKNAYELTATLGLEETGRQIALNADEQLAQAAAQRNTPPSELEGVVGGLRIMRTVQHFAAHPFYRVEFIGLYASEELCFKQHRRNGREQYPTLQAFVEQKLEPDYQLGLRDIMTRIPQHRRIEVTGDLTHLLASVDGLTCGG